MLCPCGIPLDPHQTLQPQPPFWFLKFYKPKRGEMPYRAESLRGAAKMDALLSGGRCPIAKRAMPYRAESLRGGPGDEGRWWSRSSKYRGQTSGSVSPLSDSDRGETDPDVCPRYLEQSQSRTGYAHAKKKSLHARPYVSTKNK